MIESFLKRAVSIVVLAFYLVVFFICYLRDILKMYIHIFFGFLFLSACMEKDKQLYPVKLMGLC